jgi:hypothetical protein
VLAHARSRLWVPSTPRDAVDSYWRTHPVRADHLARSLAAMMGSPAGWTWRLADGPRADLPVTFRTPPAPYRESAFFLGPGRCCVCGSPVFRLGWHEALGDDRRPSRVATWHSCCVVAWTLWTAPSSFARQLRARQGRRCPETGMRLLRSAEIDHRTPLFLVWQRHRHLPWPELLRFWGVPNLQVVSREAHARKCTDEMRWRAARDADVGEANRGDRVQASLCTLALL